MAKKVEVEIDVQGNVVESLKNLRALKQSLKEVPAGTAEWSKIKNQIRDVEDALESANQSSEDFKGLLENAPGPLGMLGGAIKKVELATKSWGAALKATGIGLVVAAIGGLVAAFSQTEGSLKKLEPLLIGLEKIFGGIIEVFTPLLDAFLELALQALPYITKGIGIFYSSLVSLFTLVKEAGIGVGKILKGVFTLDFDSLEAGYKQLTGSWDKTVKSFTDGMARYEEGTKKMTKTEKENLEKQREARQKALDEKLKMMDAEDKLDKAKMERMKAEALAVATTEQEKLDIEKKFQKLSYDALLKDIEDKQKLYNKDSVEFKALEEQKIALQTANITKQAEFKEKQKEITKNANKELLDEELQALELRKAKGEIKEDEYQKSLFDIKTKYAADDKAKLDAQIAYEQFLTGERKKLTEKERAIIFQNLQDQIDALDRLNQQRDDDFAADIARMEEMKTKLQEQRDLELAAAEGDEQKQLEIRKKYADAQFALDAQITANQKAQAQQRIEILNMYADVVGQFGAFLQQAAGKNKGLAKAGLLIEQAAGIARIVINTQANAAKAGYLSPKGIAELVAGGIGVAAAIAATIKGIKQIDSADSGGSGGGASAGNSTASLGRNYEKGGLIGGRRHAQGGTIIEAEQGEAIMTRGAVTLFRPLLSAMNQMGGGTSFNSNMFTAPDNPKTTNPAMDQSPLIMKTYVVSNELTTEAEKQARLKDLSTL